MAAPATVATTTTTTTTPDALLLLRSAISADSSPALTTAAEPTTEADKVTSNIAEATHIQFNHTTARNVLPLSTATRFEQDGKPVDLRSIFFAWQTKDQPVPDYISGIQKLTEEIQATGKGERVVQLVFAEKLDLITWLEGASDESEHIRALNAEEQARQAGIAADVARGSAPGAPGKVDGLSGPGRGRQVDPRLREILNGERRMGDRNTALRGIKPTDFSHVRKMAEPFVRRDKGKAGARIDAIVSNNASVTSSSMTPNPALAQRSKSSKRVDPIILVSPSASSLLRMSNIKMFLDEGTYIPADQGGMDANRQTISRMMPSIDATRPLRFTLVDNADLFKQEYWSRVAAVFTTGQVWQFKSYKWQSPPDLFAHALGIYVGWQKHELPREVEGWGRGVARFGIAPWNKTNPGQSRWQDREVVEGIWSAIEESMRSKGMNRDGALTGGR